MTPITLIAQQINGSIAVPGSKSISNRILICAALGEGKCRIKKLLMSDDTHVMIESLKNIGVQIEQDQEDIIITGSNGIFKKPSQDLYLKNAGTAMRFLTTMAHLIPGETILKGNERMHKRPIKDLVESLRENGSHIDYLQKDGYPPLVIKSEKLNGGNIYMKGDVSSQYISSLLLSAPYAENSIHLHLENKIVSQPYIDITLNNMKDFGVTIKKHSSAHMEIINQKYILPNEYIIEADASSSSYPLAMAAITGGKVTITNLGNKSIQGDAQFCYVLEKMGCKVTQTKNITTVEGPQKLKAIDIDLNNMTDTFMTLAVLAATAEGVTKIYNIANQRVKECDRISAMAHELQKCGIQVKELKDGLEIHGGKPHGANIECYDDHRIAMSFGVLGCLIPGIKITDQECTAKTYPHFWKDIHNAFGIKYRSKKTDHS